MEKRAIWVVPIDIRLMQSIVLERLAGPGSDLELTGELDKLSLPLEFVCPLSGEPEVVTSRTRHKAFLLNHKSWRKLSSALTEEAWKSESLLEMRVVLAGELAFFVGDSFHPECVSIWPAAPSNLASKLEQLNAAKITSLA